MEDLLLTSKVILADINKLISKIEDNHLTNEQWVIDWLDKLNELSVKY